MPSDESLLKEIREEYSYYADEWRDIHNEGKTDMRYRAGDPWDSKERKIRKDADRPVLASDELGQYINQLVNEPRQNPRGIKINPKGSGANDKTAETRESIIREIQYNSRAQSALTTGFQGAAERSYGYWRVGARYKGADPESDNKERLFEQELYIGRIPNPDSVLFHPDYTEIDASDAMGCFVLNKIRKEDFKRRHPGAEVTDFAPYSGDLSYTNWVQDKTVLEAEYWRVSLEKKKLHLVEGKQGPIALYDDELPKEFDKKRIKRTRTIETRKVTQYITNGVEILDKTEIPIPWIPIIPVFGMELWIDSGAGARRQLLSLIRLARGPFMQYCYLITQEAEEAGMSPKTPVMGYVGQFETDRAAWTVLNKIPRSFIQIDPITDQSSNQVLPLPQWKQFVPNFQAYELAIDGARRRIQAAMGVSALPTAAQRQNEKSGVALQRIESQEDRGSFHFIDNYNHALEHTGRILDAWIPYVYDTATDIGVRDNDQTHRSIRINDPEFTEPDDQGQPVKKMYDTQTGEHGVTVSTGPNEDSQREEASDLIQQLVSGIEAIAPLLPPGAAAKMLALAIKMKNIGPLGDEMAEIVSPPADQQAMQNQMGQLQQQAQQSQQVIQQLQAELQKLQLEKAGKVIDNQFKSQAADLDRKMDLLIALIKDGNKATQDENAQELDLFKEVHGAAHDAGIQAVDHAHEKNQAATALAAQAQQPQEPQGANQ